MAAMRSCELLIPTSLRRIGHGKHIKVALPASPPQYQPLRRCSCEV
uniref:Uncharacterized protein n=1 Tax=Rhizophora mucronata TaxID=61149 RepID=A0A2P2NI03_RHIMU